MSLLQPRLTREEHPSKRRGYSGRRAATNEQRFRFYLPEETTHEGCWEWEGTLNHQGYGAFWLKHEGYIPAHRYSYSYFNNTEIPKELYVCHKCDNPTCVNPNHLFLGTPKDNSCDMGRKKRNGGATLPGELHSQAKLTEIEVKEIRKLHKSGLRQKEIAKLFNQYPSHISRIVTRKSWKHVE